MNDPINGVPTSTSDTKQDSSIEQTSINEALNQTPTTTTTTTTVVPETTTASTPSPLSIPSAPPQDMPTVSTTTVTSDAASTPLPTTPLQPLAPPTSSAPMGDDTPLAFSSLPSTPSTTTTTTTVTPPVTPTDTAFVPPLPGVAPVTTTTTTVEAPAPKKSKTGKILAMFFGFLLLGAAAFGGYYYVVNYMGEEATVAEVEMSKCGQCVDGHETTIRNGKCVQKARLCSGPGTGGTPGSQITTQAQCKGCSPDGFEWRWSGGSCHKSSQICGVAGGVYVNMSELESINSKGACEATGHGQWCQSVDSTGKSYAFCMANQGQGGCNAGAVARGYTIQLGIVKCIQGTDGKFHVDRNDPAYANSTQQTLSAVEAQCLAQAMGTGSFICKEGVKGVGGVVYSGGACTNLNGKPFTGNLGCFCGVVQVDTGTGHQSYQSSCGCNTTTTPPPSAPPSTPPTMSCTGITRTPTTASPLVGSKLTFTCAGVVTPPSAGTLSYKFRYSLNSGAVVALPNKTATTAELTLTACGSYSVQCQACATLNGVLTCNPTWTGATQ